MHASFNTHYHSRVSEELIACRAMGLPFPKAALCKIGLKVCQRNAESQFLKRKRNHDGPLFCHKESLSPTKKEIIFVALNRQDSHRQNAHIFWKIVTLRQEK